MATVYDWSPLLNAINGQTSQWGQRNQTNSMIDALSGKQPAPNTGFPAQDQRMTAGSTTQGPNALAGINPQVLQMLRSAPPQVSMPLLLQLGTKSADREQNIADKRVTPLSLEEAKSLGLRPGGVYGRDISGNVVTVQDSDLKSDAAIQQGFDVTAHTPVSPWQTAQLANDAAGRTIQQGTLAETRRHNQADEEAKLHPFGINADTTKTGDEFLKSMNPAIASQIKAIASYRQAPPANRATPAGIALMSAVNQYNPSYDASQYGSKVKARNDFTTGKNGNTVRSLNVAVQHLDQLGQLSDALANNDLQMVNKIGNIIASQTGGPAPSNFNAARQIVGDEIVKAIVGAGGGVSDREEAAHNISAASSPQQLAGVIKTYQGLLGGQLKGLKQQYQKSTGLTDFEEYLAPETRAKLEDHAASGDGKFNEGQVYVDAKGNKAKYVGGKWVAQ